MVETRVHVNPPVVPVGNAQDSLLPPVGSLPMSLNHRI